MADSGEKTEDATPQQKRKARERGEVAKSKDLTSAVILIVATLVIANRLDEAAARVGDFSAGIFATAPTADWSNGAALSVLAHAVFQAGMAVLPLLATIFAAALAIQFLQVGPLLTIDPLTPKLSKFNPVNGLKKMFFSLPAYVELLKAALKVIIVAYIFYQLIRGELPTIIKLSDQGPVVIAGQAVRIAGKGLVRAAMFFLAIAALDFFYQRWQHGRNLRMTREQVKQEYKDQEGNAEAKSQRKHLAQQLANQSMLNKVRKANVIVTNPDHIACALRYDTDSEDSPRLLGKGTGYLAEKIKEVAREEGIPMMRDVTLAHALYKMEEDEQIPEELFDAVVEVLKWVEIVMRSQGQTPPWIANPAPADPSAV